MFHSHNIPKKHGHTDVLPSCNCRAIHRPALFAFCYLAAIAIVLLCTAVASDAAQLSVTDFRGKHIIPFLIQ